MNRKIILGLEDWCGCVFGMIFLLGWYVIEIIIVI